MSSLSTYDFSTLYTTLPHNLIKVKLVDFTSWFHWWVSFAPEFQCYYFCESSCLFYLSLNSDFYVSEIMHL